MKFNCHSYPSS